tara:strand:- start:345 stop:572 length:228 start_codon:yes stop_codon:yes gene_type:complete
MAKLTYNEDDSLLIESMLKVALKSLQNTLGKDFETDDTARLTEIIKDMEWARSEESNISETGSTSVPANCETCEV